MLVMEFAPFNMTEWVTTFIKDSYLNNLTKTLVVLRVVGDTNSCSGNFSKTIVYVWPKLIIWFKIFKWTS